MSEQEKGASAKVLVGTKVRSAHAEVIAQRAEMMRWSKSQFLEAIVESWVEADCPAVHPADIGAKEVQRADA